MSRFRRAKPHVIADRTAQELGWAEPVNHGRHPLTTAIWQALYGS